MCILGQTQTIVTSTKRVGARAALSPLKLWSIGCRYADNQAAIRHMMKPYFHNCKLKYYLIHRTHLINCWQEIRLSFAPRASLWLLVIVGPSSTQSTGLGNKHTIGLSPRSVAVDRPVHAAAFSHCPLRAVWLCLVIAIWTSMNLLIAWVYPPSCQGFLSMLAHYMHHSGSQLCLFVRAFPSLRHSYLAFHNLVPSSS